MFELHQRKPWVQKDGQPGMLHIFVHVAVHAAMERNLRERELTSLLFVALVPDTIPDVALVMGFRRLLLRCEDLILGAPFLRFTGCHDERAVLS